MGLGQKLGQVPLGPGVGVGGSPQGLPERPLPVGLTVGQPKERRPRPAPVTSGQWPP